MKRLVYMMMALVVLFAANSCKDKKTAQVITPTDSLDLEEVADDSTIYGVCGEGTSMHNLELISDEEIRSLSLSMMSSQTSCWVVCWQATASLLSVTRHRMER